MKTISNLLVLISLFISTIMLMPSGVFAQQCECDPDPPRFRTINHPDATGPNQQGRYVYDYSNDTIFRRTFCGANPFVETDPCRPWTLEFFGVMTEVNGDCVIFDSVGINWDTTVCHDFRYEFVYPLGYVAGNPADSIAIRFTMRAKPADTCDNEDNYYCLNDTGHYIDLDCWVNCLNQRISIYGHDVCPIPNTVVCRIEWDSPLPVELNSFSSSVNRNDVMLNWSTGTETNNSGFHVERYYGGEWKDIAFIAGSGTTSGIREYSYTDRNLRSGAYSYRLKQVDYNGNFEYFDLNGVVTIGLPAEYNLSQNYPNPFNPTTTIVYGIPADGNVTLKIYDNTGREIRTLVNEPKSAGYYSVTFSAGDLASGMYFYKLESGNFVTTKKMILMK